VADRNRVDQHGRAYAGSQRQIQIYSARQHRVLESAVASAVGRSAEALRWCAPLEEKQFEEPLDRAFLESLKLEKHADDLAAFWPGSGPRWDGLASLAPSDTVLLIEGKSYPAEMRGSGCQAKARTSLDMITKAIDDTKRWLGADTEADWLGPLYQYGNRLAHVRFLRERGVEAWLVNLCFTDDETVKPTSEAEWRIGLADAKKELGLAGIDHVAVDVLLPAVDSVDWPRPEQRRAKGQGVV